jgi:hypothetical protein
MNAYAIYALKRLIQFALVVFIGINLTLPHHPRDTDRSGRADHRGRDRLRQHQSRKRSR